MQHDIEPVDKIGSMALIRQEEHDIDCNVFSHIGRELSPGMIWGGPDRTARLYQAYRSCPRGAKQRRDDRLLDPGTGDLDGKVPVLHPVKIFSAAAAGVAHPF